MSTTLGKRLSNAAGKVPGFDPNVAKKFDGLSDDALKKLIKSDPDTFAPVLKNMDDADVSAILKNMDEADRIKIINQIDPSGVRNLDGRAAKAAGGGGDAMTIMGAGALVGMALYIDNKYAEAEEEYKDCMAGCLPHNWDEYENGSLQKSDLNYSTVSSLQDYGVTPIANQPYCSKNIDNCGDYCNKKCDEETDVDIPGMSGFEGLTNDLSAGLGGIIGNIFGGLFEGVGLDNTTVGIASSASISMCCMLILMMFLLR
tara:strand:+ start:21179 stop:21952 length:774 start_codon:yes stop_codon:yes gene_type:complete